MLHLLTLVSIPHLTYVSSDRIRAKRSSRPSRPNIVNLMLAHLFFPLNIKKYRQAHATRGCLFSIYFSSFTFSKFDIRHSLNGIRYSKNIWTSACNAQLLILYLYLLFHLFQIRYSLIDIRYSNILS
jgi:hypothetical protein